MHLGCPTEPTSGTRGIKVKSESQLNHVDNSSSDFGILDDISNPKNNVHCEVQAGNETESVAGM